ncbi:Neuropeptide-Like Protein [Ditylenchus destructor]|uniref:Neuropeptide-Like Protein n=1 Tax=Ditylenchus destructor TaxID=166010 RepID=A0AAD4NDR1_9BILA|nr:Neuropeptide-Like Protein [Ditylenchus destructor]
MGLSPRSQIPSVLPWFSSFSTLRILLALFLIIFSAQLFSPAAALFPPNKVFGMAADRPAVFEMPQAAESQYMFQPPMLRSTRSRIQRRDRPCLINAGLSQGCDLSDILYAKYQANKFSSFAGPGR